jgi:hypothetical protein
VRRRVALTAALAAAASFEPTAAAEPRAAAPPCPTADLVCSLELTADRKLELEPPPQPRAWRGLAAIEVGITLTIATIRYQFDGARKENWDFTSIRQRLSREAWRYDNNPFGINYFAHTFEGTIFHLIGRSSNLSLPESAALGFMSSFAWEFLFEFRERVSVNDVLFTPGSGIAAGEFFHWLAVYLDSAPENASVGQTLGRYTFALAHAVHRKFDGVPPPRVDERDALGLRADIWHRFDLSATGATVRGDIEGPGSLWAGRAAARLVAIDGYRRPGAIAKTFTSGNVTEASFELTTGDGADGTRFWAESVLAGVYRQDIDSRPRRGWGWLLGAAMSYDYRREQLGDWRERLALLHLPGIAADGELHRGDWTLRAGARLHPDFGSLEAIANRQWLAENPDLVDKTILRRQGYYFGWGGSLRLFAELSSDWPVATSIGASLLTGVYDSDEGLDRNQDALTSDVDIDDNIMEIESWLRIRPIDRGPHLELRVLHQRHATDHDGIEADQSLTRFAAGLGVSF